MYTDEFNQFTDQFKWETNQYVKPLQFGVTTSRPDCGGPPV